MKSSIAIVHHNAVLHPIQLHAEGACEVTLAHGDVWEVVIIFRNDRERAASNGEVDRAGTQKDESVDLVDHRGGDDCDRPSDIELAPMIPNRFSECMGLRNFGWYKHNIGNVDARVAGVLRKSVAVLLR